MNINTKLKLRDNILIPTIIDKTTEKSIYSYKRICSTEFSTTCWIIARMLANNISIRSNDNLQTSFTRGKIKLTEIIYQSLIDNMEVVE